MNAVYRCLLLLVLAATASPFVSPAWGQEVDGPGQEALKSLRGTAALPQAITNRYFLKTERFEVTPAIGYVPNNPMVYVFTGSAAFAYHMSEQFAIGGQVLINPIVTRGYKALPSTLVTIAEGSDTNTNFQQPVDRFLFGFTATAIWAPVYGKINLVGETVVNFDLYGLAGFGVLAVNNEYYRYVEPAEDGGSVLEEISSATRPYPTIPIGVGANFFITQSIALKLEARNMLYIGPQADYDPESENDSGFRPYNNLSTTAGIAIFFPKMQSRFSDY